MVSKTCLCATLVAFSLCACAEGGEAQPDADIPATPQELLASDSSGSHDTAAIDDRADYLELMRKRAHVVVPCGGERVGAIVLDRLYIDRGPGPMHGISSDDLSRTYIWGKHAAGVLDNVSGSIMTASLEDGGCVASFDRTVSDGLGRDYSTFRFGRDAWGGTLQPVWLADNIWGLVSAGRDKVFETRDDVIIYVSVLEFSSLYVLECVELDLQHDPKLIDYYCGGGIVDAWGSPIRCWFPHATRHRRGWPTLMSAGHDCEFHTADDILLDTDPSE